MVWSPFRRAIASTISVINYSRHVVLNTFINMHWHRHRPFAYQFLKVFCQKVIVSFERINLEHYIIILLLTLPYLIHIGVKLA